MNSPPFGAARIVVPGDFCSDPVELCDAEADVFDQSDRAIRGVQSELRRAIRPDDMHMRRRVVIGKNDDPQGANAKDESHGITGIRNLELRLGS